MHSTNQVLIFVFILTSVVSISLAGMYSGLKNIHTENEALYSKRATLSAVQTQFEQDLSEFSDEQVQDIFSTRIEQKVLNMKGQVVDAAAVEAAGYKGGKAEDIDKAKDVKKPLEEQLLPVFVFKKDDGKNIYILNVRGKGLWDEIWGFIALDSDVSTIAGVSFDHKAETPGLGAEIKDNKSWANQFIGTKIYKDGEFTSVFVRKGGAKNDVYEVDGISGATITANGVSEMLKRGLAYYKPYLESVKS